MGINTADNLEINNPETMRSIISEIGLPDIKENYSLVGFLLEEITLNDADPESRLQEIREHLAEIPKREDKLQKFIEIVHDYMLKKIERDEPEAEQTELAAMSTGILQIGTKYLKRGNLGDPLYVIPYDYWPTWLQHYSLDRT
ncbi:MAG: hypothetical protein ABH856_04310 [Patescibacteria group bacterium]|nr:hypothetical protein [Patescibacteria group bacterium]